jgi:hypothetical protein
VDRRRSRSSVAAASVSRPSTGLLADAGRHTDRQPFDLEVLRSNSLLALPTIS